MTVTGFSDNVSHRGTEGEEDVDEKALFERLDKIITLLEIAGKKPSLLVRVVNGVATGIGILGILSAVDIIRAWLGG